MKELFKNCLSVREESGWYKPFRFTKAQLEKYSTTIARSRAPSSVALSFRTAAKSIKIEYRIGLKARDWASFDLTVDGALSDSVAVTDTEGFAEFTLPGDESREISIYLPHLVEIEIKAPVADAPLLPTEKNDRLWLALGDSITQGMVAKRPSSAYPSIVSSILDVEVINAGVGGIIFNVEELDHIGREPDLITVALGCNDWGRFEPSVFKENVRAYLGKLYSLYTTRNIKIILPIWRSDEKEEKGGVDFPRHRQFIREVVCEFPEIEIIDGYEQIGRAHV